MATNETKVKAGDSLKEGSSFTDTQGRTGIVKFDTKTGKELSKGGSTTALSSGGSTNSIIKNQSNLVQTTDAEKTKQNNASLQIDNKLQEATGIYGTPVYDNTGKQIGVEKYDTKTGKPLENPADKKEEVVEGNIQDELGNKYFSSMPGNMSYQLPNPSIAGNKWVFDSKGKPFEMTSGGKIMSNIAAEQEYNINVQKNKEIEESNALYDTLKSNVSAAHQVVIDNIKKKAELQKKSMEDLNSRYLQSKKLAGFRTGATEYTPEIAMGILKNEEQQGIQRIQEIDDQMVLSLAEAVSAKNSDELDVAQQKFETYQKLQKEKEGAVIDLYKTYIDNQKYINDAEKALETEERAREDQSLQVLKDTATGYLDGYNKSKDKNAYINKIATELGLRPETVLSQIKEAIPKPTGGSSGKKQTVTEIKAEAIGSMATGMQSIAGSDGYIDPDMWIQARRRWNAEGFVDADFLKNFKQYLNPESYKLVPEFAPKKKTTSGRQA